MPRPVIRRGRIVGDTWQMLALREGESPETVSLPTGLLAVTLPVWRVRHEDLLSRSTPVGVRLETTDDPSELAVHMARLAIVTVHFRTHTDGRGYSLAYLLRRRHEFTGELRAVGDVQRDQLFYLARCGFDSFELREGDDSRAALPSLRDFSATYQAGADGLAPRFRLRNRPPGADEAVAALARATTHRGAVGDAPGDASRG